MYGRATSGYTRKPVGQNVGEREGPRTMTALFEIGIIVLKSITLVFGALIVYYAYRAFAATRAKPIRALSVGFAFITLGVILAGIAHEILPEFLAQLLLIEAILTATGFGVILYSLYAQW